jgi:hypothetical protein
MILPPVSAASLPPAPAAAGGAVAQAAPAAANPAPPAVTPQAPLPAAVALQLVLAAVRQDAAAMQNGLAVLMANALQATAQQPNAAQFNAQQPNAPQPNVLQASVPQASAPQLNAQQINVQQASAFQTTVPQANVQTADIQPTNAPQANAQQVNVQQTGTPQTTVPQPNASQANAQTANTQQANVQQTGAPQATVPQPNVPQVNTLQTNVPQANLVPSATGTPLPPAVQAAVQQLVSLHLPTNKTPDARAIKTALQASGLFTEALLAEGSAPADLKAALGQLAQVAKSFLAQQPVMPSPPNASPNVPPPVRGGPPVAQGTALPTLPADGDPVQTAKLLAAGSDAALARQTLLQMASLPDPQNPAETRWIFDVPLMTPQGAAVAQLIVTRDGKGTTTETPDPVWRLGLAIDVEPLGPVRANLALSGGHAWVTIGADRADSLDKLVGNSGWLSEALTAVELESDIAFQAAQPAAANGRSRLVDHAS